MLRKFIALLMISAFTHVSAMQPIAKTQMLGNAFDELNFALNVEWDQRDQNFFNASVDDFEKNIAELQKQGLSNKELVEYTMNKIKDEKTKKEVESIVTVVNESNMSPDEARAFIMSKLSSMYANGASWSGGRVGVKLCLLLAVILIIVLCSHDDDRDDDRRDDHKRDECDDHHGGHNGGYTTYGEGWDRCNNNQYPEAV